MLDSMPKLANMKAELQSQVLATMSTGGAAKLVSVPPMEILTKRYNGRVSPVFFFQVPQPVKDIAQYLGINLNSLTAPLTKEEVEEMASYLGIVSLFLFFAI